MCICDNIISYQCLILSTPLFHFGTVLDCQLKPNIKSKARPVEKFLYSRHISEKCILTKLDYKNSKFVYTTTTRPHRGDASLVSQIVPTQHAGHLACLYNKDRNTNHTYLATDIAEVTHYQKEKKKQFWRKLTGALQLPAIWGLKWILELFSLSAECRFWNYTETSLIQHNVGECTRCCVDTMRALYGSLRASISVSVQGAMGLFCVKVYLTSDDAAASDCVLSIWVISVVTCGLKQMCRAI